MVHTVSHLFYSSKKLTCNRVMFHYKKKIHGDLKNSKPENRDIFQ